MANDALDPGPLGDYPWWPHNVRIDVTPRHPVGIPIAPPGMVPP